MLPANQTVAYDTSALYAVFNERDEDGMDYGFYLARRPCLIGWPTLLELQVVLTNRSKRPDQREFISFLVSQPNITPVEFGRSHYAAAAEAMVRYGKGRGHPAQLNYGDCMAYAVAKVARVPLIYKGNDFAQTDINLDFA
jgi:ribonuclease VapC